MRFSVFSNILNNMIVAKQSSKPSNIANNVILIAGVRRIRQTAQIWTEMSWSDVNKATNFVGERVSHLACCDTVGA